MKIVNLSSGFTDNLVIQIDEYVAKYCATAEQEAEWYLRALELNIPVPKVLFKDKKVLVTSYIEKSENKIIEYIPDLCKIIRTMSIYPSFNNIGYITYIDRIILALKNNPRIVNGEKLIKCLNNIEAPLNTFNHGDFSTLNIILNKDGAVLIDPIFSVDLFQSFVLDIAKFIFSLLYYGCNFEAVVEIKNEFSDIENLDIFVAAEACRVSKYKKSFSDIASNLIDGL